MSCEREILKRLNEYRTIKLPDGSHIWRTEDGEYHLKAGNVTRDIKREEYLKLRKSNTNLSPGDYEYPHEDIKDLPKEVRDDILDFEYHYYDVLKNSIGPTTEDTLDALNKAIEIMKIDGKCYSDIKNQLSKHTKSLISSRIENKNANEIN